MLKHLAEVGKAQVVWHRAAIKAARDPGNPELAQAAIKAQNEFISAAYTLAFELVPHVLSYVARHGPIVTLSGSRWTAIPEYFGFLVLQTDEDQPGHELIPYLTVPVDSFERLIFDLPELLPILRLS